MASVLLPIAAFLHVLEEWFGGFVETMARIVQGVTAAQFWIVNAVFLAYCMLAAATYRRRPLLLLAAVALVGINALIHTAAAIVFWGYSPGVFSALTLYVPLTVWTFGSVLKRGQATAVDTRRAVLLGAGLMVVPLVVQSIRLLLGL